MRKISAAFLLVLSSFFLQAQQPAYFRLGENQFEGVQIYDVIQDKDLNYLFATNEGIYYFDYYTYRKIECDKTKSNSVYNFVMSSDGTIYCHNLNDQIFKIKEGKCFLFYELRDDEHRPDLSLDIVNGNQLIVGARKIIVFNDLGIPIMRFKTSNYYLGPSFISTNKKVHFHLGASDTILVYSNNSLSKHKATIAGGLANKNGVFKMFKIDTNDYALDLNTNTLYSYNETSFELKALPKNELFEINGSKRIYESGNGVWIAGSLRGAKYFNGKEYAGKFFYEDYFISNVFKDNEGNTLLSTFDKGVLVIPDLKAPYIIQAFPDDPVTSLYQSANYGLVMGTSKGKLLNYSDGKINIFNKNAGPSLISLYGDYPNDLLLFDNEGVCFYDLKTQELKKILLKYDYFKS